MCAWAPCLDVYECVSLSLSLSLSLSITSTSVERERPKLGFSESGDWGGEERARERRIIKGREGGREQRQMKGGRQRETEGLGRGWRVTSVP